MSTYSVANDLWDKLNTIVIYNETNTTAFDKYIKFTNDYCKNTTNFSGVHKKFIEKFLFEINSLQRSDMTYSVGLYQLVEKMLQIASADEIFNDALAKETEEIVKLKLNLIKKDSKDMKVNRKRMSDDLIRENQKLETHFKKYQLKFNSKEAAKAAYIKAENNKALSRIQVENYQNAFELRQKEYQAEKDEYIEILNNFNQFQRDYYTKTLTEWGHKAQDIENDRYNLLRSRFTNLSELCKSRATKFLDIADEIEENLDSIDLEKDLHQLVSNERSGDVPPVDVPFRDLDESSSTSCNEASKPRSGSRITDSPPGSSCPGTDHKVSSASCGPALGNHNNTPVRGLVGTNHIHSGSPNESSSTNNDSGVVCISTKPEDSNNHPDDGEYDKFSEEEDHQYQVPVAGDGVAKPPRRQSESALIGRNSSIASSSNHSLATHHMRHRAGSHVSSNGSIGGGSVTKKGPPPTAPKPSLLGKIFGGRKSKESTPELSTSGEASSQLEQMMDNQQRHSDVYSDDNDQIVVINQSDLVSEDRCTTLQYPTGATTSVPTVPDINRNHQSSKVRRDSNNINPKFQSNPRRESRNLQGDDNQPIYSKSSIEVIRAPSMYGPVQIVSTPAEALASLSINQPDESQPHQEDNSEYDSFDHLQQPHNDDSHDQQQHNNDTSGDTLSTNGYFYTGSCVALHQYLATNSDPNSAYLSFNSGDQFYILQDHNNDPSVTGWVLVERTDRSQIGYVPDSYIDKRDFPQPIPIGPVETALSQSVN